MSLKQQLLDNNYLLIDNFITPKRANELYSTFKNDIDNNRLHFENDITSFMSVYNYYWFLELLIEKIPFMSEIMEEPMFPTYCYARLYKNNDILIKHKDRAACEISVTLNIGSDGTKWPINFMKPNGEEASCNLNPGQAVIYLATISTHWREEFKGQEYGQVFLHYVRARGDCKNRYFDKLK